VESPTPVDLTGLLHLDGTTHTNAGDYPADAWTFDGNSNYNGTSGTVHDSIAKANATIVVTPYSVTYDGNPHTATGTATGVKNESLSGLDLSGTTHTSAGTTTDTWTFTDATGNYNNASSTVSDSIAKANTTIVVTPYSVTYDGNSHTATGTATGVKNESLSGLDLSGTTHTSAGTTTDTWTFTDVTGNYNNTSGTVSDSIAKANATINVTPYSVTYDATAHTATGTAKGVLNESLSGLVLTGTTHTPAGTYATDSWTFTDVTGNYNNTNGTVSDSIAKANVTINVTPYSVTYDATAHTATGTAKGVLNESLTGLVLSGTTHTAAGTYATDSWTFTDVTGNYNNTSGTVSDSIALRNATWTTNFSSKTYGDLDPNPLTTGSGSNFVTADNVTATYSRAAGETVPGGPYHITATLGPAAVLSNYNIINTGASLTINKAVLTVTANNKLMTLHGVLPTLTASDSGFKFSDTFATAVTGSPSITTTATSTSAVGPYPITPALGTLAANNYSFAFVNGTLNIQYATGGICGGVAGHQILQPINADATSVFKLGSTVPTKFRVCDANGVSIVTPGVVTGYGLIATANTPGVVVDEDIYSTTPDTAFRNDGQQWIFNQSTKNNPTLNQTGMSYFFTINLNDGTSIFFQYALK
jgi:hypothetical protein